MFFRWIVFSFLYGIISIGATPVAATEVTKVFTGKDNWGNQCWLELAQTNEKYFVGKINYVIDAWDITYSTETVWGQRREVANILFGKRDDRSSLKIDLDQNGLPYSFYYFDNSGTGFKRRSFECKF